MDLDILDNNDLEAIAALAEVAALKRNKKKNVVTIAVLVGGKNARQYHIIKSTLGHITNHFRELDIKIKTDYISNDIIFKNKWSPHTLFDKLLSYDIHIIPTHGHQGTIARRGENNHLWTADNYVDNLLRLTYHLGYPMGKFLLCPVYLQDKV